MDAAPGEARSGSRTGGLRAPAPREGGPGSAFLSRAAGGPWGEDPVSLRLRLALSYLVVVLLFWVVLAGSWALLARGESPLARSALASGLADRLVGAARQAWARGGWEEAARVLDLAPLPPGATLALYPPRGPALPVRGAAGPAGPEVEQARAGSPIVRLEGLLPGSRRLSAWLPVATAQGTGVLALRVPLSLPSGVRASLALSLLESATLAGLVAFAAGMLWAGYLARPVARLAAASEALGRGDLSRRVEVAGPPEMVEMARSLNRMAARLEAMEKERRDFLADVSHTLRTPLAAIQGWTEALQDGLAAGEEERYLERIHRQTCYLSRAVARLLDLSRLEAGALSLRRCRFPFSEPLLQAAEAVGPGAEERGLRLVLEGPVQEAVEGDPERVREILQALLENAVEHARQSVRVAVALSAGRLAVEVRDDGPGLPRGVRLFERFGSDGGGTGLGLALARRLVEAHGGRLEGVDAAGGGACFSFTLPRGGTDTGPGPA